MPDRPHDPHKAGKSDGSGPDFDWLYGAGSAPSSARPAPSEDPDDRTRLIPTTGSRIPATNPTPTTRRPRRKRRWARIVLAVVVVWLAFVIAVPFWAWSKVDKINAIGPGGPADQPGNNFLLVGSDSREGLSKAQNRKLGTGGVGVDGGRTDTIMILHTGSGPSLLMSIPRDSLVPIPGHGTTKINAAYAYGGPRLLVKTIEQDTGLHIDHYVEIGLGGFVNVVDALGGVRICPRTHVRDPRANLNVKKGCQTAGGATALGWSRSRHAFALGDIERELHQRQIVHQIASKVKSPWTVLNPLRYYDLAHAVSTSLRLSKGTSLFNMINFGLGMSRVNGSSGMTCGMPIANLSVQWDHTRALRLLGYIKADHTSDIPKSLCTKSGLPK